MGAHCRVTAPHHLLVGGGGELRKDTVVWIPSIKRFLAAAASAFVWRRQHLSHALKIQKGQEVEELRSFVPDSAHTELRQTNVTYQRFKCKPLSHPSLLQVIY